MGEFTIDVSLLPPRGVSVYYVRAAGPGALMSDGPVAPGALQASPGQPFVRDASALQPLRQSSEIFQLQNTLQNYSRGGGVNDLHSNHHTSTKNVNGSKMASISQS